MKKKRQKSEITQRVADNLRRLRAKERIAFKDMAEAAGVTERTYFRYESGAVPLTIENLYTFAAVLGVSASELLGE